METNLNNEVLAVPEIVEEFKTCKCCNKTLPINHFAKKGVGRRNTCNVCLQEAKGVSSKFINISSRELMEELRNRGYIGILKKTKIIEYNLDKL